LLQYSADFFLDTSTNELSYGTEVTANVAVMNNRAMIILFIFNNLIIALLFITATLAVTSVP
jgi:hypothetical protein